MPLLQFVQRILSALAAAPVEAVLALWRALVALLLALLLLIRKLLDLFGRDEEPSQPDRCDEIPPHVKRKPDPSLYCQTWLTSLGLAVTWDNPDIWISELNGTLVPSSQLQANTDYVVHARIHDASFDPALATEVRCLYRPWSFNSPDRVPVETNPDGTERIAIVHIPPWSSQIADFRWRTPAQGGHFCLQVECHHPDDINPNNNLGQENTTVLAASAAAGLQLAEAIDLFNPGRRIETFRLRVDGYTIPRGEVELRLDSRERHLVRRQPLASVRSAMVTRDPTRGVVSQAHQGPVLVSHVYRGWDPIREMNKQGEFEIARTWDVRIEGIEHGADGVAVELGPGAARPVAFEATVPPGVAPGPYAMNVSAHTELGRLVGGATFEIEVQ